MKLNAKEKKQVAFELTVRFPRANTKAGGKAKAKAGAKRAATPRPVLKDKDGNERCQKFINGTCDKGENCAYSHKGAA